jgi:hypothetical protein
VGDSVFAGGAGVGVGAFGAAAGVEASVFAGGAGAGVGVGAFGAAAGVEASVFAGGAGVGVGTGAFGAFELLCTESERDVRPVDDAGGCEELFFVMSVLGFDFREELLDLLKLILEIFITIKFLFKFQWINQRNMGPK